MAALAGSPRITMKRPQSAAPCRSAQSRGTCPATRAPTVVTFLLGASTLSVLSLSLAARIAVSAAAKKQIQTLWPNGRNALR